MPGTTLYEEALEERKAEHRFRMLRESQPGAPGEIVCSGRNLINFASNDYLGLSRHPMLKRRSIEYVERYGAGATASRLLGGNLPPYEALERQLAAMKHTETALILPTGFQTNSTVLPSLAGAGATIACDRLCHNSLLQGAMSAKSRWFRYAHNDASDLRERLQQRKSKSECDTAWIVTESVFGMDGDLADLSAITEIASEFDATIFLDEAHASGVLGPEGMGFGGGDPRVVSMGTFGKGLGSFGAYIACTNEVRDYLINFAAGFIYSTALPPAVLGAIGAALDLVPEMQVERSRLAAAADDLRTKLRKAGFDTGNSVSHIIPVIVGSDKAAVSLSSHLEEAGIFAPAIRPPTVPENSARIRVSLTLDHTDWHRDYLIDSLKGWHERKD